MATYVKAVLSGSTDGRGILVDQTATAGTLIHSGPSATTTLDEIYLYAYNDSSGTAVVNVEVHLGGDTDPDDRIKFTIASKDGLYNVIPGLVLQGNATPLTVRAIADVSESIVLRGYVNRIDQS